jgi:tetraacyldisaccharide 4'-kinase
VLNGDKLPLTKELSVLLISGIANPLPLKQYLDEAVNNYDELLFQDHQIFTIDDMKKIVSRFEALEGADKIIITTEKDAVRLIKFEDFMLDLPVFSLPIEHRFLFDEGPKFDMLIEESIQQFNYSY